MKIAEESSVYLSGDVLPLVDDEGDVTFREYIDRAVKLQDLELKSNVVISSQITEQNRELQEAEEKNLALMSELREALEKSENAKKEAESNLDLLQKKTQFELMSRIVKVALGLVVGVGLTTTILYVLAIITGKETALIGNTWSSMFGILLTNSFSIIGTIMGVKYATENKPQ